MGAGGFAILTKSLQYDLIVFGGGAAGMTAAEAAAAGGKQVLLLDSAGRLGGERLWSGCIPSKALIHLAHTARQLRLLRMPNAADDVGEASLAHVRRTTRQIAKEANDRERLEKLGVEVVFATARLCGPRLVDVVGRTVKARRVLIATGASPIVPPTPGLSSIGHLTNRNLFDLETPPTRLAIIGGGLIGIEMAQAFQRLGSRVTVLSDRDRILPEEDAELAAQLTAFLTAEGVKFVMGVRVERIEVRGVRRLLYTHEGEQGCVDCDEVLVAVGRRVNVERLGLEEAGLSLDLRGIQVSSTLRAQGNWLYAAGDITGQHPFAHIATYEARLAVQNAFRLVPARAAYRWLPRTLFTDPALAHLGPTEEELQARRVPYTVARVEYAHNDRARTDLCSKGLVKLLAAPNGRLLAAHILGPRADELMNEVALAARTGLRLPELAAIPHLYPTVGDALPAAALAWLAARKKTRKGG